MGKRYYTAPDTNFAQFANSPNQGIVDAILDRVRYHFCKDLLYSSESYSVSQKRFLYADISDNAIRQASSANFFNLTGAAYPFTAFKLADPEYRQEVTNHYAKSWNFYDDTFKSKVSAIPMILNIDMVTFFTEGDDYQHAISLLFRDSVSKSTIILPLLINGTVYYQTVELEYSQIGKGNYAWEFEQELQKGKIRDVIHNIKVYYHDISLNYAIAPVDDIELALDRYSDSQNIQRNIMPETPYIVSTIPSSGSLAVHVDVNPVINFNTFMLEESVEASFSIWPPVPINFVWNSSGTVAILDTVDNLMSGTLYTMSFSNNMRSSRGITAIEDFEFQFTTEEAI